MSNLWEWGCGAMDMAADKECQWCGCAIGDIPVVVTEAAREGGKPAAETVFYHPWCYFNVILERMRDIGWAWAHHEFPPVGIGPNPGEVSEVGLPRCPSHDAVARGCPRCKQDAMKIMSVAITYWCSRCHHIWTADEATGEPTPDSQPPRP